MDKNDIKKLRAQFLIGLTLLIYPVALIFAIIWKLLRSIFGSKKYKSIAGEIAVVTGGGHGLGRCIAIELAKNGCNVAVADINLEGAEHTSKILIEKYNVRAKAYQVDVTNLNDVTILNQKIIEDLGIATILVNNAGMLVLSNFLEPDAVEVQRMINVNLTSHFWTNQVFLPNMKSEKKGHIVAIASLAGLMPLAFSSQYTSTKYAIRGMMRALRLELKARRYTFNEEIHATTVCPGFLKTNDKVVNIVEKTGLDALYPLMTGEEVAERTILGILRNEEEIIIPGIMSLMHRLYESFPVFCQDLLLFIPAYLTVKRYKKLLNSRKSL